LPSSSPRCRPTPTSRRRWRGATRSRRRAPDTRRTWLRFADGDHSGCNLFLLARPTAADAIAVWQTLEDERKRPLRMVRRLGWTFAARYALGRLPMAAAAARLGALAGGARFAIVALSDGRAAIDVDKPTTSTWCRAAGRPPHRLPAGEESGDLRGGALLPRRGERRAGARSAAKSSSPQSRPSIETTRTSAPPGRGGSSPRGTTGSCLPWCASVRSSSATKIGRAVALEAREADRFAVDAFASFLPTARSRRPR
jgi:hypothetical protein